MISDFIFLSIIFFFTSSFWNLDGETSKGFALSKLSDALIIGLVLILTFKIRGIKLKNIFLTKGRLVPGLIIGILLFTVFGYLAIKNPEQPFDPRFIRNNYVWILIFVLANGFMEEFFASEEEITLAKKHGSIASSLHTDLHECLGHGSGQLLPGTKSDALKNYSSALEETRADLFALYYLMDEKMIDLGLIPSLDVAKAEYNGYIRNGLMTDSA